MGAFKVFMGAINLFRGIAFEQLHGRRVNLIINHHNIINWIDRNRAPIDTTTQTRIEHGALGRGWRVNPLIIQGIKFSQAICLINGCHTPNIIPGECISVQRWPLLNRKQGLTVAAIE